MMRYQQAQLERQRRLSAGLRTWGPPGIDIDVAAHEGGHAVVGWLLGLNPTRATIEPGGGFEGMVHFGRSTIEDREQAFDYAVFSMAGDAAEKLLGGPADCGKNDLTQARAIVEPFCRSESEIDDMIDDARRAARRMLKAYSGPLIEIVTALLTERTLDREQINKIMTPADDDDDDGEITLAEFMAGRGEASRAISPPRLVLYRGV
jgi:ATP-dependent Zn protease